MNNPIDECFLTCKHSCKLWEIEISVCKISSMLFRSDFVYSNVKLKASF